MTAITRLICRACGYLWACARDGETCPRCGASDVGLDASLNG